MKLRMKLLGSTIPAWQDTCLLKRLVGGPGDTHQTQRSSALAGSIIQMSLSSPSIVPRDVTLPNICFIPVDTTCKPLPMLDWSLSYLLHVAFQSFSLSYLLVLACAGSIRQMS
ncbi:hypothetical protein SCP_0503290 [Sparassis crispa]|uniref:Uncharacterized protein n=1 Tax=Sparassis crispa TaxID=139825 RepID=A0A401GM30_9APHY|nr:hypothetical protein SCP_0503290 [Sparassis crispa]GBE83281.1 hypothetical protein SCP_0503290 [Sparassis crispa]